MNLDDIEKAAGQHCLSIYGALHPGPDDSLGNVQTIVLLGPQEPGFWAHFTTSAEFTDGRPDPVDRWSRRIIDKLATEMGAQAFLPFGGPPHQPFIRWAQESGRAHVSPVGMLVHDMAGLWVSYRGALGLTEQLTLPETRPSPCLSCTEQPCRTACPVDALGAGFYDVPACKADLDRAGNDCMARGCAVRRICPVSQSYGRVDAQSAFHMEAFR